MNYNFIRASLLLSGLVATLHAQEKPYFQQRVDYTIKVALNDEAHTIAGNWAMRYTNQSPDTLHYIYMHLYPNAYKNRHTALAQQLLEERNLDWWFGNKDMRGYIDSLHFSSNGQKLRLEYDKQHIDIAKIHLATPLAPNQSIDIQTPMFVKIPETVSRLGHVEQSYQMTQWYPKPAVYDRDGWHAMPYLDQGEFFSEFGSFDVEITLPSNYVVGATGELQQNEAELQWLRERAAWTSRQNLNKLALQPDTFPPSSANTKTLRYRADNVHDFAWFADKRFYVINDSVRLANDHWVQVWAMFSNNDANYWKNAHLYLKRAVRFYSDVVGNYPYSHATAVQSALSAGGGMEYPMITVIGDVGGSYDLDVVIMHEVGHNWFYGILASNEREYAWLDEGMNSYVESRYINTYYPHQDNRQAELAYWFLARRGGDQPICTHSADATGTNYYLTAYGKPTLLFRHLEKYLGTARMDSILHQYFDTWKFRHPYPNDLRRTFEAATGEQLGWFFDDWIMTNKRVDFALRRQRIQGDSIYITIANDGELNIPVSISSKSDTGSVLQTQWLKGLAPRRDTVICFPLTSQSQKLASVEIDAFHNSTDINTNNNSPEPLKVRLGGDFRNPEKKRLNFLPILGGNQYDGFMLGVAAYNLPVPLRKVQYTIAPMYSFHSRNVTGFFDIQYNHFPRTNSPIERLTVGINARSFSNNYNKNFDYFTKYVRLNPYIEIELPRPNERSMVRQTVRLENLIFGTETPQFEVISNPTNPPVFNYTGKKMDWRSTHRLIYGFQNKRSLNPFHILATAEYANYTASSARQHYLKLSVEGNFVLQYAANYAVYARVFAGGFVWNTMPNFGAMPLQLASRNITDYQYDQLMWGRSEQEKWASQQINIQDGGFKTPVALSSYDGHSNLFITAINLKADIPVALPFGINWLRIRPYFDMGYFANTEPSVGSDATRLFYNGGLMLDIGNGVAGVYMPLMGNKELMNQVKSLGNMGQRISFSVNSKFFNPTKLARTIEF